MIQSLLIANRGEIACRIIRTARGLGIRTIAVYSDADANALHVQEADDAVHIGASPTRESYLVAERILDAARQTRAEAIHPGYGFLSENAEFAQAVSDAGIVWVGPNPSSITAMGLKDAAKKLMAAAGVPVTPGYMGEDQDPDRLAREAAAIGYPVLIKAVAGGGGKGMRLVESAESFEDALTSCKREAASSFGNDHVLIEKYIASPRHIEVQVFGDRQGNVVHLFERDCSLQRRHQKVIEEAPAPGMDAATREALCAAAVRAAKAVDYVGAGTIEFIADGSGALSADRIWFMEMNTRLQVEHPVTEAITGVDLVEWQLRVASGEPLPLSQDDLTIDGWAMEARLYAEDPAKGFLPSIGRLELLQFGESEGGRIDTGVYEGAEVSPFYDPMIAKVIAWGEDRDEARERLGEMLEGTAVWPVRTNASFLVKALQHADFAGGKVDTGLIGRDGEVLAEPPAPSAEALRAAASALVPTTIAPGLRLNAPPRRTAWFLLDGEKIEIELEGEGSEEPSSGVLVTEQGQAWLLTPWRRDGAHGTADGSGAILAPMPGKVIHVEVSQGQSVTRGQKLLTLEAMKMEHTLTAPFDGVVARLEAVAGQQVQVDVLLAQIEETE
ncbi:acetyl/propionyl/methylcrotonyl-CoA carboxylase subunit alpha [Novosphingobium panipatense]|uniref:3-methylcrotonyl-CoA carboxylase alpha subunit n=1 Tax=Novosphingobium panipatense TaxID=428991 RepID=A0ABY1QBG6_9SPHN|nr:acetyl/propionyl/methylcrotonyl-CoA carboxylase subunit alpha [Novosphingobium panipatense]SMP66567.1 3-methylcrotonyl-CoA carboxylase alpha subunit [Novosphingobium panipatense]